MPVNNNNLSNFDAEIENLQHILHKVNNSTRSIKYDDTVSSILSDIQQLAKSAKIEDKEINYSMQDVINAQRQLESAVYSLSEIFKDKLRDLIWKKEELDSGEGVSESVDVENLTKNDLVYHTMLGLCRFRYAERNTAFVQSTRDGKVYRVSVNSLQPADRAEHELLEVKKSNTPTLFRTLKQAYELEKAADAALREPVTNDDEKKSFELMRKLANKKALANKKKGVSEEFKGNVKDTALKNVDPANHSQGEGDFVKNQLHSMKRVITHLDNAISVGEDLPDWVQSEIAQAADKIIGVMNYSISSKEQDIEKHHSSSVLMKEQGATEGKQKTMSRAAKGNEKYGKDGMEALAKAGRDGASEEELDVIRDKHNRYKDSVEESWSKKYKDSINCSHPKGFSQKAHCAGKKKHNESVEMEMVCEDCGMCQTHGSLNEIKKGQKDANGYTRCWPGKHAEGTKKGKNGGWVRKCVSNENVEEGSMGGINRSAPAQDVSYENVLSDVYDKWKGQKVKVK